MNSAAGAAGGMKYGVSGCSNAILIRFAIRALAPLSATKRTHTYYGRPLSVSGRPCYILPMFLFIYLFFYGRLILRPWLTEVRESFTRGGP